MNNSHELSPDSERSPTGAWPVAFVSPPRQTSPNDYYQEIYFDVVSCLLSEKSGRKAIVGAPGSGKSNLVRRIASHPEILDHFCDGILWARPAPYISESVILGAWGNLLGCDYSWRNRAQERSEQLKHLLHDRKVLLLIDDAQESSTAQILACGGPNCSTILTTEEPQLADEFSWNGRIWALEGLRFEQGVETLAGQSPEVDWDSLIGRREDLHERRFTPLEIAILAGIARSIHLSDLDPDALPLWANAAIRSSARFGSSLSSIASHDQYFISEILNWALQSLPDHTAGVLRGLAQLAPQPDWFSLPAAENIAGARPEDLELLSGCRLLQAEHSNWFSIHPLVAEVLQKTGSHSAAKNHSQYYQASAANSNDQPAEMSAIYGQLMWLCTRKTGEVYLRDLVNTLSVYQEEFGLWEDYRRCGELALQTCKQQYLCQEEGRLCNNLGKAAHMLGDTEIALSYYSLAEDLLKQEGEDQELALVLYNSASIELEKKNLEAAQRKLVQGIALIENQPTNLLLAYLHNQLGKVFDELNMPLLALDEYNTALDVLSQTRDQELEAVVRYNLSQAYRLLGRRQAAYDEFQRVVAIEHSLKHPDYEADAKQLARMEREMNQPGIVRWIRKMVY